MAGLMRLIEKRQGDRSDRKYAKMLGIDRSNYWRYKRGQGKMDLTTIQKLSQYYASQNDAELIAALAAYALDLKDDDIDLGKAGKALLDQ
jgi:transcriptional regulator with XRE-family HTH domain